LYGTLIRFDGQFARCERAPLVRLQIDKKWPSRYFSVKKTSVTPTFILVEGGLKIDRLLGYPGDEHFWYLPGEMLRKL